MHEPPEQYAIALSYASENEALAKAVFRHLRSRNIDAFFSPSQTSQLWGKDEHEFERIYGPDSRYVVPFISEDYIRKEWPRLEFRAARKEARKRSDEFILPVRVDDSALPGLRKKTQYVDARQYSPKQIAEFLIEKLESNVRTSRAESNVASSKRVRILRDDERELLGLLTTVVFPLRISSVRSLVPEAKWDVQIARWRKLGYVTTDVQGFLRVDPTLQRQLLVDKVAVTRWRERWVTLLDPLRGYTDTALMLALELIGLFRMSEAVGVLAAIVIDLEPGFWNGIYVRTFEGLAKSSLLKDAADDVRVEFHNAYGTLLLWNGNQGEALVQFARLRTLSRRVGNVWGEGQSYINAGGAAANADDVSSAIAWYQKAVVFGKKHRDYVLAGRAIGNIANFVAPADAGDLLEESDRLLLRGGDVVGLAGTAVVRGNAAALQADFTGAAKHYRYAIRLSKQLGLRHVRAIALRNLARTEVDRDRPKKAYPLYQESAQICQEEGFAADQSHAVAGEAIARMQAREFARAGKLFDALAKLHRDAGQHKQAAIARHDVGTMFVARGRHAEAYRIFTETIREFKKHHMREWVRRTQVDAATVAPDERAATLLLTSARRASAIARDFETLQRATVKLAERKLDRNDVEGVVREIDIALRTLPPPLDVPFISDRFRLILETGRDRRIAPAFHRLVASARSAHDRERVIDAHMELGDYLWAKNSEKERANAYQAYAVAMSEAVQLDAPTSVHKGPQPHLTILLKIGTHAFNRVYWVARHGDVGIFTQLEDTTRAWLLKQDARQAPRLSHFTLWPVRLAARVYALPSHGRGMSMRDMRTILTEEFQRAFGRAERKQKKRVHPRNYTR